LVVFFSVWVLVTAVEVVPVVAVVPLVVVPVMPVPVVSVAVMLVLDVLVMLVSVVDIVPVVPVAEVSVDIVVDSVVVPAVSVLMLVVSSFLQPNAKRTRATMARSANVFFIQNLLSRIEFMALVVVVMSMELPALTSSLNQNNDAPLLGGASS